MRLPEWISRAFHARGDGIRSRLELFEAELHEGVDFLIARRDEDGGAPHLYRDRLVPHVGDALCCLRLRRAPVPMHLWSSAFSTGVFLSVINLVPGGIGIMEGSMAAVFSSFGVPLETAWLRQSSSVRATTS
jgi:hypothetical protein